ncbi:hypothetical protein Leryth_004843 [Lithospermum erythrorhizon]|nr:hypothetical protein Leryth_004843 [Lithospermum erythrorhizon]
MHKVHYKLYLSSRSICRGMVYRQTETSLITTEQIAYLENQSFFLCPIFQLNGMSSGDDA